jgi:hypothetical protein
MDTLVNPPNIVIDDNDDNDDNDTYIPNEAIKAPNDSDYHEL